MAEVRAPDGATWVVRRRWAPRILGRETPWQRLRRRMQWRAHKRRAERLADGADGADPGCLLDALDDIAIVLVVVVLVVLAVVFVLPVLLAALELLLLLVLGLLGVLAKVVFRRPWIVEADGSDGGRYEWRIVGWRASGEARDAVAQHLEATGRPPATVGRP